eukprot:9481935-Pyramimonas_sp.AAC.1
MREGPAAWARLGPVAQHGAQGGAARGGDAGVRSGAACHRPPEVPRSTGRRPGYSLRIDLERGPATMGCCN